MDFDKTLSNIIGGYELQYGIIYGNENIVFIKCGAGGTISTSRSMSPTMVADYIIFAKQIHQIAARRYII